MVCGNEFKPNSNNHFICSKPCLKIRKKQYRKKHYSKYKKRVIKETTEYNKKHPEKRREICKRYYQKHREKILFKQKEYYNNSPNRKESLRKYKRSEKGKLSEKRYRATRKRKEALKRYNHSEKGIITGRLKAHRYNERKRGINDKKPSRKEIQEIFKLFNNKCFNCGGKTGLEIEHFYPLSKGFGLFHGGFNVCVLCRGCNATKNNKHPKEFYKKDKIKEFDIIKNAWMESRAKS